MSVIRFLQSNHKTKLFLKIFLYTLDADNIMQTNRFAWSKCSAFTFFSKKLCPYRPELIKLEKG